jgi:hypothetical protein
LPTAHRLGCVLEGRPGAAQREAPAYEIGVLGMLGVADLV